MTLYDEKSDKKKQKCSRKIIVFEAEWDFSLFIPGKNSKCSTNLAQICRTFSVNIENFVEQFEKCSPWGTFCRIFPNFVKLFLTVNILKNVLQKNVHKKGKIWKMFYKNVLQDCRTFSKMFGEHFSQQLWCSPLRFLRLRLRWILQRILGNDYNDDSSTNNNNSVYCTWRAAKVCRGTLSWTDPSWSTMVGMVTLAAMWCNMWNWYHIAISRVPSVCSWSWWLEKANYWQKHVQDWRWFWNRTMQYTGLSIFQRMDTMGKVFFWSMPYRWISQVSSHCQGSLDRFPLKLVRTKIHF